MTVGDRIREAAAKVGGQIALAEMAEVSRGAMTNYVSGKTSPQLETLERISKAAGVSAEWLAFGSSDDSPSGGSAAATTASLVALPRYDIQASAGSGSLALNEDVRDFMSVSREWLSRYVPPNARIGVIETRGDSMEPTIRDGDILMVTHDIDDDDVAGGGIFVISVEGHLMVKRLHKRLNGDMQIISDNERYEKETIAAAELAHKLVVHARVFWHGGPI